MGEKVKDLIRQRPWKSLTGVDVINIQQGISNIPAYRQAGNNDRIR